VENREVINAQVVIVGAGPAGLACAIRLAQLIKSHNQQNNISNQKKNVRGGHFCFRQGGQHR